MVSFYPCRLYCYLFLPFVKCINHVKGNCIKGDKMVFHIQSRCVLYRTLCDKVCRWLAVCRWFSPVSSTNKTGRHDIAEILLKVALSTTITNPTLFPMHTDGDIINKAQKCANMTIIHRNRIKSLQNLFLKAYNV